MRRFDPSTVRHAPIGRRRHLEVVNSAGSNPAARTNATVAQLVGGSGFKHRAVSVRIGPVAPRWRSPTAEAASLNLVPVSVQIGPSARVPFRSAGCNPADCETERRVSRGSTPRGPTIRFSALTALNDAIHPRSVRRPHRLHQVASSETTIAISPTRLNRQVTAEQKSRTPF